MRVVSYGKTFVDNVTVDTKLALGEIGLCSSDGTAVATTGRPQSFVVMSTIPTKDRGIAIQRGIDVNPFNFTYEVRKYTEADQKETIVLSGLTNPALKVVDGVTYSADAEFCGAIEIVSSEVYRNSPIANPNPQIIQIPIKIRATDTIDRMVEKIKSVIFMTTYNKELFDIEVVKEANAVKITAKAKKTTKLTLNCFGIVADQKATGVVTVNHTKLSGFLNDVMLSEEDNRYSAINYGWNPNDEWQKAWGLGDPKEDLDKVGYICISTAEFNQFPEIAADNNCPRKIQLIVASDAVIDTIAAKLDAIKKLASGTGDNGIAMNTAAD